MQIAGAIPAHQFERPVTVGEYVGGVRRQLYNMLQLARVISQGSPA
jgi:hypothetical protein